MDFPWLIVAKAFGFFIIVVGGYVYMFLHVMRTDPREIEYRKKSKDSNGLIPKKLS